MMNNCRTDVDQANNAEEEAIQRNTATVAFVGKIKNPSKSMTLNLKAKLG